MSHTTDSAQATSSRSAGARILIVDDDSRFAKPIGEALERHDYRVSLAYTAAKGIKLAETWKPDVVILDLMLPDMEGIEAFRGIRNVNHMAQIIVLSACHDIPNKVMYLQEGAYDYAVKPCDMDELIERVRVGLRSFRPTTRFRTGRLLLDFDLRQAFVDEEPVQLTPKEFDLLKYLAIHVERLITNEVLLREVWGVYDKPLEHSLRVFVCRIRRKIDEDARRPCYLFTSSGGYRLTEIPPASPMTMSMLPSSSRTTASEAWLPAENHYE